MKLLSALALTFVVSSFFAVSGYSQSSAAKKKTKYTAAPAGSLLGGGYADTGETGSKGAIGKARLANENPAFRKAIMNLEAEAGTVVEGLSLIATAVAWQTKVPVQTIKHQREKTGMSYGELLVANSLATGSGKTFNSVVAMRAKNRSWGQIANELKVSEQSIIARANAAGNSIKFAEGRRDRRREQNVRDNISPDMANPQNIPGAN